MYANRAKPADGYTALLLAASQNHLKLVRALLRCRAEVNQSTHGPRTVTPSASVGAVSHRCIVECIRRRSTHGRFSPLMAASAKGHALIVLALLQARAEL